MCAALASRASATGFAKRLHICTMLEVGKVELAGQTMVRWPLQNGFGPFWGVNTSFEFAAIR
ncbi:hypothetical protein [Bradyrhizobium valentinum]|uniref:hypothetical protein n=1 Tax=Bradyrhizobium valentinum TaxID=1518501 RepID=UPI0012E34CB9|nr:hypothetical protein [Bradyrhizobium valentinum]